MSPAFVRTALEGADRETLVTHQAQRLTGVIRAVSASSNFYSRKFAAAGIDVDALRFPDDLTKLPFTTKGELIADQAAMPPYGTKQTLPLDAYTRYCQTSSTTGSPLRWLDTSESWQWIIDCWKAVFAAAGVGRGDRIFFPFSFGPFLGFWSAFDAGSQIGAQCIPGGGMSSQTRLGIIRAVGATVVCCTPTYALWLAEVAEEERRSGSAAFSLAESSVRALIVAGEPGGSIPSTRSRIERCWGARVFDHYGLTETGPIAFECSENPGALHLNEADFLCEVISPFTDAPVPDGERGELVVTNLGRAASPAIRYRTRDIVVRRSEPCACGRTWSRMDGGILSRADDMINVRGVNVYPAAIESIVRGFPEIVEFRSIVSRSGSMRNLSVEVEPDPGVHAGEAAGKLAAALRAALGLSVAVRAVEPGALPRFEMKARRFVVEDTP